MSKNVRLNRNQRKALAALIAEPTITRAAEVIGVNPKTIHRYLEIPEFRAELEKAQQATIYEALGSLVSGVQEALDTLKELHKSAESESVRRSAASDWISYALRLIELADWERRLKALEEGKL